MMFLQALQELDFLLTRGKSECGYSLIISCDECGQEPSCLLDGHMVLLWRTCLNLTFRVFSLQPSQAPYRFCWAPTGQLLLPPTC